MSAPTKTAAFLKSVDLFVVKKLRGHGEYLAWYQLAMATVMCPNIVLESQKVPQYSTFDLILIYDQPMCI